MSYIDVTLDGDIRLHQYKEEILEWVEGGALAFVGIFMFVPIVFFELNPLVDVILLVIQAVSALLFFFRQYENDLRKD